MDRSSRKSHLGHEKETTIEVLQCGGNSNNKKNQVQHNGMENEEQYNGENKVNDMYFQGNRLRKFNGNKKEKPNGKKKKKQLDGKTTQEEQWQDREKNMACMSL